MNIKVRTLRVLQTATSTIPVGKTIDVPEQEIARLLSLNAIELTEEKNSQIDSEEKKEEGTTEDQKEPNTGSDNDVPKKQAVIDELCILEGISPELASELFDSGIVGIVDLSETEPKDLASLPAVKTIKFAKSLIEEAGTYLITQGN